MDMDVLLREGNRDSLSVKLLLHLAGDIPEDFPVIGGLRPRPADEIDGGIGELVDPNDGLGGFENLSCRERMSSSICWAFFMSSP